MTPRNYDIETSELIVLQGDDGNNSYKDVWAIFDVSRTTETRFVAVHWEKTQPNEGYWTHEIITVFDHVHELMLWCAHRQMVDGAEFRTGMNLHQYQGTEWLDDLAQSEGYDTWKEFIEDQSFLRIVKQVK